MPSDDWQLLGALADGALREARSLALIAWPAQTARPIVLEALIALEFRSLPFHDPFHGPGRGSPGRDEGSGTLRDGREQAKNTRPVEGLQAAVGAELVVQVPHVRPDRVH
jgi:hypothetical protein